MSVPAGPGTPSGPAGAGVVGVGVDAVDVDRFRRVLDRRPGIARRLFTEGERADATALGRRRPAPGGALRGQGGDHEGPRPGHRGLRPARRRGGAARATGAAAGAPSLRLGPGAAAVARDRRVDRWHLSLTHTAHLAVAVVVAERAGPG